MRIKSDTVAWFVLAILLAMMLSLAISIKASAGGYTDKYDAEICKQSRRFLIGQDCDWLKAQLIQESRLKPGAVSPVGARGLGQIMPATWADICQPLLICHIDPFDPTANIMAAAFYQAGRESFWTSPRPASDRKALGLASYNAGAGNLLKAQKQCGMPSLYACIIKCLPEITGFHSVETINYVKGISGFYLLLKGQG